MSDDQNELDKPLTESNLIPSPLLAEPVDTDIASLSVDTASTDQQLPSSSQISQSQERTRARIAWTFTLIFLLLMIITLLWPTLVNLSVPGTYSDPLEATKALTTTMASVLAGPFGFIVGFYFKQDDNNG